MRSVGPFRILILSLCLLALATFALVSCGGGDAMTTMLTQVSTPPTVSLPGVQVPDVVGMSLGDATTALQAVGLNRTWEMQPDLNTVGEGPILEQDPQAGALVPIFSTVHLVFAAQGDYLPDVIGMGENDAFMLIGGGGTPGAPWTATIVYATTFSSEYWGVAIAQTPAPGVLWSNHPPVTIVVGQAPESVTTLSLPNVGPVYATTTTTLSTRSSPTTTTTVGTRGGPTTTTTLRSRG